MAVRNDAPSSDDQETSAASDRRGFLRSTLVAGSAAASLVGLAGNHVSMARAQGLAAVGAPAPGTTTTSPHRTRRCTGATSANPSRRWSRSTSGDFVTIETLTHHANDDASRMIQGDSGAESVYHWDGSKKNVDRRGAGPMDASLFGRGAGEGLGVHILTGPVAMRGAEPGDVLEVRILDVTPRPCANPEHAGKSFGSNAAAWWGFHYKDLLEEPKPREVITIYEVDAAGAASWARAVYNFRWVTQKDPFGVVHEIIDYPGVPVDHAVVQENHGILKNVRIPIRPHFGVIGLAPAEAEIVDSIPPSYTGGNIDNWRIGKGATAYYPVAVPGALLSVGDPHASQGDSELCGTAIECSLTGTFQLILHKNASLAGTALENLQYPCSRRRRTGWCTASASPTTWPSSGRTRRARSTASPRSTSRCATRSARCGVFSWTPRACPRTRRSR